MSLLLDALKKAAEKKAKKSAESSENIDQTELDSTQVDDTDYLKTQASDSSEFQPTERQTGFDATELDSTEQQTQFDNTELDSTQDVRGTDYGISKTSDVEHTEFDPTESRTQIDSTEIESTEVQTRLDVRDKDDTELETSADTAEIPKANYQAQVDLTEIDETESQTGIEPTEMDSTQEFSVILDEDHARTIEDEDAVELVATKQNEEETQADITDTYSITKDTISTEEEVQLTDDDVTEFMGDGFRDDDLQDTHEVSGSVSPDDTTVTNPDSLSLTGIEYDEDLSLEQTQGKENSKAQYQEHREQIDADTLQAFEDEDSSLMLEDITGQAGSTEFPERSTTSQVDLDQLTNDQTVTIKSTTATRTLAPDNYDRTLLKLSDSDVSNIFPGMKSDASSVMTPDYAKKVFLNKAHGLKTQSYKLYGGLGALILLLVLVWGLFQLQDESDMIDQGLVRLKQDPMPGIIKTKKADTSINLFAAESAEVDGKAMDLIAKADGSEGQGEVGGLAANQASQNNSSDGSIKQDTGQVKPPAVEMKSVAAVEPTTSQELQQDSSAKTEPVAAKTSSTVKPEKVRSNLEIASSSRVSKEDQILETAYNSYESGDIQSARREYNEVLSINPKNRDALLGRAAIHVHDKQFENAIELYQLLLVENPKDSLAMTSLISVANINPQAGESQLKSLLREQPNSPYLHFALGNMYGSQNLWAKAQSAYFTALQFKPEDPNYAYNLAVSLEHMNKQQTAVQYYGRALQNQNKGLATFDSQLVAQRIEVLSQ